MVATQAQNGFNPIDVLSTGNIEQLERKILADNQRMSVLKRMFFDTRTPKNSDTIRFPLGGQISGMALDISNASAKDVGRVAMRHIAVSTRPFAVRQWYNRSEHAIQGTNAMEFLMDEMPKARSRIEDVIALNVLTDDMSRYETISANVGGGDSALNVDKLIRVAEVFEKLNVPQGERFVAIPYQQYHRGLLADAKFTNQDWVFHDKHVREKTDTMSTYMFRGMNLVGIGEYNMPDDELNALGLNRQHLPTSGNTDLCVAWSKKDVAMVVREDPYGMKDTYLGIERGNIVDMGFWMDGKPKRPANLIQIACQKVA